MKEILVELSEAENYASLPLYQKRLFWCIVDHFIHKDHEKFTFLCGVVAQWMMNGNDNDLKLNPNEINS